VSVGPPVQEVSASVSLLERGILEHDWHRHRRCPTAAHHRVQTVPMDRLHPAPDSLAVPDCEGEEAAIEDATQHGGGGEERARSVGPPRGSLAACLTNEAHSPSQCDHLEDPGTARKFP